MQRLQTGKFMREKDLSLLEKYIVRYPWYGNGYVGIFEKMCTIDKESARIYLAKAAARTYSRGFLYRLFNSDSIVLAHDEDTIEGNFAVNEQMPEPILDEMPEIVLDEMSDIVPDNMPKFVLAGGDYFSRRDFEEIELDRSKPLDNFIAEKPSLLRSAIEEGSLETLSNKENEISESFTDAEFYTETLANIYIEQGFYKRALDVYSKLILLYPEKSSYFASLVKEIKKKYN